MTAPSIDWNETAIATLRALRANGLSASRIGERLGVTRNAVIGKLHRMGIVSEQRVAKIQKLRTASDRMRVAKMLRKRKMALVAGHAASVAHTPGGKTIFELGLLDCKWPLGPPREPAVLFCGERALAGRPYCEAHCKR